MLKNVRFNAEENLKISGEESAKILLVRKLSLMGDIFVNGGTGLKKYLDILKDFHTIVLNGPAGLFEEAGYALAPAI